MKVFLPIIQDMIEQLSNGENIEAAVLLQKQILKIFYALIQYTMPLALINAENFLKWMDIISAILGRQGEKLFLNFFHDEFIPTALGLI